ncbi:MAG TPA: hypothetical protein VFA70_11385 [Dehalococcoidia bacterium]|nr:hypothetical protein [Dehalococcoidia bacterium]
MRLLGWIGRHTRAVWLGSAAAAIVLLVGGLVGGMSQASGSPAPLPTVCASCPPLKLEQPTSHYIVGTIALGLAPGRVIVRTAAGRFVVVEYDRDTIVRKAASARGVAGIGRGTRVIILGTPRDGRFYAEVVTVTGRAPARTAPARQPAPPATRPPATRTPALSTPKN